MWSHTNEIIMNLDKTKLLSLQDAVDNHDNFIITCHVNADGDALGSSLALMRALEKLHKEATVITPDLPPSFYSWMPGMKKVRTYDRDVEHCNELIEEASVVFVLDYNDFKRAKALGERLMAKKWDKVILIDHHTQPVLEADIAFSHPEQPATCSLLYNVMIGLGWGHLVDSTVASCLYTGICTDTGGLSYNSSDPEIYITIADLLKRGIDKTAIHEHIFNNKTMKRLKMLGYCLGKKMHRIEKYPLAIMVMSSKELEHYNYNTGDTEGFVNFPLQVRDVVATAFIMERPDGIKISMRSKGEFPVNEFAAKVFNGGGHKNAAGANYEGPLDEAIEIYTNEIVKFYEEFTHR